MLFRNCEMKRAEEREEGQNDDAHRAEVVRKDPLESMDSAMLSLAAIKLSCSNLLLVLRSIEVERTPSDGLRDPVDVAVDDLERAQVIQVRMRVVPVSSWFCELRNEMLEDLEEELVGEGEKGGRRLGSSAKVNDQQQATVAARDTYATSWNSLDIPTSGSRGPSSSDSPSIVRAGRGGESESAGAPHACGELLPPPHATRKSP